MTKRHKLQLSFDPLEVLEHTPGQPSYRLKAMQITGFLGKFTPQYPDIILPKAIFDPKESLHKLDISIRITVDNVQDKTIYVSLHQMEARIMLAGVQQDIAGLWNSGIIEATTPLNLQAYDEELEAEEYLQCNLPEWQMNQGPKTYLSIQKAGKEQVQNPYSEGHVPLPNPEPSAENYDSFKKVFDQYKIKRKRAQDHKPTPMNYEIMSTLPFNQYPPAQDECLAPPGAKRARIFEGYERARKRANQIPHA